MDHPGMTAVKNALNNEPKKISHTLLEDIIDGQELIVDELKKLNATNSKIAVQQQIIGDALVKLLEGKSKVKKNEKTAS